MKQKGRAEQLHRLMLPLMGGVLMTAAISLLSAYFMQNGIVSPELDYISALVSIGLGAFTAGTFAGGSGKRGLVVGALVAMMCCLGKEFADPTSLLQMRTISEIVLCIVCAWIGSCIFHKKKRRNTRCNHRKGHLR